METREVLMVSRRGKRMPGVLYVPETGSRGFAIALHGLGGWQHQSVVETMARVACDAGYTTLTFDASDGAAAPDADFATSTTTGYLHDLEDAIAYAREQGLMTDTVMLLGHSLGGMIASMYAAAHPGEVSHLVLVAPAVSWKVYTKWFLPYGIWWFITDVHQAAGPAGATFPLRRSWLIDFLRHDIRTTSAGVSVPTLVVLGERDNVVGTPRALEACAYGYPQGRFALVPGATHTFRGSEQALADTITAWLSSL